MRIISDFYDYYDQIQSYGQDKSILYLRNRKTETMKNAPFPKCRYIGEYNYGYLIKDVYVIGFCGTLYPCLMVSAHSDPGTGTEYYCYSAVEVDTFFKAMLSKSQYAKYDCPAKGGKRNARYRSSRWNMNDREKVALFFEECNEIKNNLTKMFEERRCPIFVAKQEKYALVGINAPKNEWHIEYNACLKDVEFRRIYNPALAFQEISMWMNNQAIPEKPIPQLDDVTMAQAKGFDKYSFRKDPIRRK